MNRVLAHRLALSVSAALLLGQAAAAVARPGYSTNMSRPLLVSEIGADHISKRINDWGYRAGVDKDVNNYRAALQFARCVSRFDPAAGERLLQTPIGAPDDRPALLRLVRENRGCVVENNAVAPVLIRAALAEVALRQANGARASASASVGIPPVVLNVPLKEIAQCQMVYAPRQVAELMTTDPGAKDERRVAEELYSAVPACGLTHGLGGIEPTVARLALIEAAYRGR